MAAVIQPGTSGSNGAAPPPPAAGDSTPSVDDGGGEDALLAKALGELTGETAEEQSEGTRESPPPKPPADTQAAPPPEPDEHQLSAGFAKLRSEQKRFDRRKAEQSNEYLTKVKDFEAKEKAFEEKQKGWQDAVTRSKNSPLEALHALGWTYEQLVEYVAKEGVIPASKLRTDFKVELDEASAKSREELQEIKKELEAAKEEKKRELAAKKADEYEQKVFAEIDTLLEKEAAKFVHLRRIPKEVRDGGILDHMIQHFNETGEALAISDAMLYGEKEASKIASWYSQGDARQEGAVKSANLGAAKPETEARPISQRDASVRGVSRPLDPETMTEEEREAEALRILTSDS